MECLLFLAINADVFGRIKARVVDGLSLATLAHLELQRGRRGGNPSRTPEHSPATSVPKAESTGVGRTLQTALSQERPEKRTPNCYARPALPLFLLSCGQLLSACNQPTGLEHVEVASNDCVVCHQDEYAAATAPLHGGALSEDCGKCHDEESFAPATLFGHTTFALNGVHSTLDCATCHAEQPPLYAELDGLCAEGIDGERVCECLGCHATRAAAVVSPIHAGRLAVGCERCHTTTQFDGAQLFDHPVWPLEGAHVATDCNACHTGAEPLYNGLPHACTGEFGVDRECFCSGCHAETAAAVVAPIHTGRMSTNCDSCHNFSTFSGAERFSHPAWPLTGAHQQAACNDCHTGETPLYNGLPHACSGEFGVDRACRCEGCHGSEGDTNAEHAAFSRECDLCHVTSSWLEIN